MKTNLWRVLLALAAAAMFVMAAGAPGVYGH